MDVSKFDNEVIWNISASRAKLRAESLVGDKRAVYASTDLIADVMGQAYDGLLSAVTAEDLGYSGASEYQTKRDSFTAVHPGRSMTVLAVAPARVRPGVDSLAAVLLNASWSPAARYRQYDSWRPLMADVRRVYGPDFNPEAWRDCDQCREIVDVVLTIDSVLTAAQNDPAVKEYLALSEEYSGGWLQGQGVSTGSATKALPLEASASLAALLANREDIVIQYNNSKGQNTVKLNLRDEAVQRVARHCDK